MHRTVEPELLDVLPPSDPRTQTSRRDLRRVNAFMGNARTMADALRYALGSQTPRTIVELGAGDGQFMLRVSKRLCRHWKNVSVNLVDRLQLLAPETVEAFARAGWRAENLTSDAFDWLRARSDKSVDVIVANLFLHHFSAEELREMLKLCAGRSRLFVAVEPRRALVPLTFSKLLWAIGCNSVTRHDAAASVRAGFVGKELSQLWPSYSRWELVECPAGLFSHLFVASRNG
jgi:phospholipid N-methyltransferase